MSFIITFYSNSSDDREMTKNLSQLGTITLNASFENIEVEAPTINIVTDNYILDNQLTSYIDFAGDVSAGKINYMSFPLNGKVRYYYITHYIISQEKLITLELKEDVLMSWATTIENCEGIVRRNANLYNLYIPDGRIHTYANPLVRRKKFTNGTGSFDVNNPSNFIIATGKDCQSSVSYESFTITVSRRGDVTAKNGGGCVFIPNVVESSTNLHNESLTSFLAQSIDQKTTYQYRDAFIICPMSAIYGPYFELTGRVYDDKQFCVAKIANLVLDEDAYAHGVIEYIPRLVEFKTFNYGTTLTFYDTYDNDNTHQLPYGQCYTFTIGGTINWAQQTSGATLQVNGNWVPFCDAINMAKPTPLNMRSSNTIEFNTYWI